MYLEERWKRKCPFLFRKKISILAGLPGSFYTGHTDAYGAAGPILGINTGMAAVGVVFPAGGKHVNLIILETTILLYHVFSGNVIPNRYWFLPHILVIELIYYISVRLLEFVPITSKLIKAAIFK